MIKQIERQVHDLKKELLEIHKEREVLRLQPCKGDLDLRTKDEKMEALAKRIESLQVKIRELDRKRREMMSDATNKGGYESPF